MYVFNPSQIGFALTPGRLDHPGHSVTFVAKIAFSLVPGGTATIVKETAYPVGDVPYGDVEDPLAAPRYESDYAPSKPRADAMLVGKFHAPHGRAVRKGRASFLVDGRGLRLAVIGRRSWDLGLLRQHVSDPEPFESLDLRWEHAFGGEGFEDNPVGKGFFKKRPGRGVEPVELPRIEHPEDLVTSPKSRPTPACFAARSRMWPVRRDLMGTFDDRWQARRWPWYPEDLDLGHFNAASPELQFPRYLVGDETVELENLHPDYPEYSCVLPGTRARLFVVRSDEPARFEPVEMNLDTLWIDMEAETGTLVWRGWCPVRDIDQSDLEHIYLDLDRIRAERTDRQHEERYRALIAARDGAFEPEPEPEETTEPEAAAEAAEPLTEEEADEATRIVQDVLKALAAAGIDPGKVPDMSPEELARAEEILKKASADPPFEIPEYEEAETEDVWTRERVRETVAADEALDGLDLRGLDLSGESLVGVSMRGTVLVGARLTDCDFTNADLTDADLTRAKLTGSNLGGARLEGAMLTGAEASNVRAAGVPLGGANAAGGTWDGADLSGADLGEADFAGASLRSANLRGARLEGASFDGGTLDGAVLDGCRGAGASFVEASMTQVSARKADLTQASLERATLDGAMFADATLDNAALAGARGRGVNLTGASIVGLRAGEAASFPDGRFEGVHGDDPIFDQADLAGASFRYARIPGANFMRAKLHGADLSSAGLRGARFLAADLTEAVLADSDLFEATFERALLDDADGSGANFYGAEFLDARVDRFRGRRMNLAMTKLADTEGAS